MKGARIDCIADTSAIIGLSRRDANALAVMGEANFAITFITLAELALGIRKAVQREAAFQRIDTVLRGRQVFYPSRFTPLEYAEVCERLEKRGARIPSNDMWIAALAIENKLPLVGRDAHFERVERLRFFPF